MPNLTRNGICYDLIKSPYTIDLVYGDKLAIYYFSSKLNQSKFQERLQEHRNRINDSLFSRFKFEIEVDLIADINLYKKVEKRGFLFFYDERFFKCLEEIKAFGMQIQKTNFQKL